MSKENVRVIHNIYEAFNNGDYSSVMAALDPQVEWRMAENFIYTGAKPKVGPQAVLEGFKRIAEDWEDFTVSPEAVHDAGNAVVAEGYYTGTHRKSGKEVRAQFAHFYKLRGGRVTEFQQYTDTAQFRDAVAD
ncbi:MAG: nuclear transport factor 2 family protein [Thermodesulfobacteriota bacterium]